VTLHLQRMPIRHCPTVRSYPPSDIGNCFQKVSACRHRTSSSFLSIWTSDLASPLRASSANCRLCMVVRTPCWFRRRIRMAPTRPVCDPSKCKSHSAPTSAGIKRAPPQILAGRSTDSKALSNHSRAQKLSASRLEIRAHRLKFAMVRAQLLSSERERRLAKPSRQDYFWKKTSKASLRHKRRSTIALWLTRPATRAAIICGQMSLIDQ